jgi:ATP-dependent RNA helicase DBP3
MEKQKEIWETKEEQSPLVSNEKLLGDVRLEGQGNDAFVPFASFSSISLDENLQRAVSSFTKPTLIQSHCIGPLLKGRDVVGIAATGSGKTLAFGLPGLQMVIDSKDVKKHRAPKFLVIAPTRELAIQINEVLESTGRESKIKVLCVYGGVAVAPQKKAIESGLDVIVATPGRLLGLVEEMGDDFDLSQIKYLVLDEADRMLDMGFIPDVRRIRALLPSSGVQTVMFSATWPDSVKKFAYELLSNPLEVYVGNVSANATANTAVAQHVEVLEPFARDKRLLDILRSYPKNQGKVFRILIFVLYKNEVPRIEGLLSRNRYSVKCISGANTQAAREQALASFKSGETPILIATDVAARGLDIPDVEVVINYSFPLTIEDYVHRIGRTGRAGKTGISHTFFTHQSKALSGELINVLKKADAKVPEDLVSFGTATKRKEHSMYGAHFKGSADAGPMPKATHVKF